MPGGFESSPTAHASGAFPCSVVILHLHLARFPGYSVPGGTESGSTSHGLAAFLYPEVLNRFPPRTLRLPFRARWSPCRSTAHAFPAIPCAVAMKAVPPRHGLAGRGSSEPGPTSHAFLAFGKMNCRCYSVRSAHPD